jgi:Tol biopolymer transport system component
LRGKGSRLKAFVAFRRPIPPLLLAAGVFVALALPGSAGAATPGKIAFVSSRDGNDEIYVMNADGSGQTRLTNNSVDDADPAWSPDGSRIAWISEQDGSDGDLWVMNADGSGAHQLTFNDLGEFSIDWSPDGRQIVFSQSNAPGDDLFLINADGTGLRQLTFTDLFQIGPHFSPDGQLIAFNHDVGAGSDVLALIRPDGSGLTNLTSIDGFSPDFTADGKRIVFWSDELPSGTDDEIASIAADGSDLRQLTDTPSIMGNTDDDFAPSPSRDGLNRIAFASRRGGDNELYLMNADGTGVTPLTNTTGTNRGPDWQPTAVCQGKVATIVGTSASETLTGGPNADIISGQGGKDQISGLAGNDVICGDAGKDTLKGGKGKDVLNGGKANDKLIGGKGKDKCIGGKGKKDTAKSCEKEKKIP